MPTHFDGAGGLSMGERATVGCPFLIPTFLIHPGRNFQITDVEVGVGV